MQILSFESNPVNPYSEHPIIEEIKDVIKELTNNKASGKELSKHANEETLQTLHQTILNIWKTEKEPEEWTSTIIHLIHKNNYRGISILLGTYKILSKALLPRV